jgi:hypothetical protein
MPGIALQERYVATLTNLPVTANTVQQDMPRDFIYAAMRLRPSGTLTISAGTTNGTPSDENPFTWLRRIYVEGTGGGQSVQLKNYKGRHARRAQHGLVGVEPKSFSPVNSGAVAAYNWYADVPVDFLLPGAHVLPEVGTQTVLDPREYEKLTLTMDLGDTTDFVNGGDRTLVLSALSIDVFAVQVLNVVPSRSPMRYIETFLGRDATSAIVVERQFTFTIPTGKPYRYMMIATTNEAGNLRQPVDDTIGAVKLYISQTLLFRFQRFQDIQQKLRRENIVQDAVNPASLNPLSSTDSWAVGYYLIDYSRNGRFEGMIDASRFPARGIPILLLHDILTASARQVELIVGFVTPGPSAPRSAPTVRRTA